ncbi:unnamed protein product [Nezara viridula]|uniref:Uncharacterized protein n=1 Tax=Nezara viridula TaxID=85310 RepID=A0A9P0E6R3_NEZVI|nr:unnamed protein product [Nezara viridula]
MKDINFIFEATVTLLLAATEAKDVLHVLHLDDKKRKLPKKSKK